jgi:hypothetical protein
MRRQALAPKSRACGVRLGAPSPGPSRRSAARTASIEARTWGSSRPRELSPRSASIRAEAIADNADAILGLLVRQGFPILEARSAYELVTACALGSAILATREQNAARAGRPVMAEHLRVLAQRGPGELPHLRMLLAEAATHVEEAFLSRITTVLIGIAIRHGEPWEPIARRVGRLGDTGELPRARRRRRRARG